jgi:hypothetical protein
LTWTGLVLLALLVCLACFSRMVISTWQSAEFKREVDRYREVRRHRKAARRY